MARDTISTVWANANPTGTVAPSGAKQDGGWSAEKPPYQNFNWMWNLITGMLQNAEQNGIMEWSTDTTYPQYGLCLGSDGVVYQSIAGSNNANNPVGDGGANWTNYVTETAPETKIVPEHDASYAYAQYDVISGNDGAIYVSQVAANTGNALSNATYWKEYNESNNVKASKGRLVKSIVSSGTFIANASADDSVSAYITSLDLKPGRYLVRLVGGGSASSAGGGATQTYGGGEGAECWGIVDFTADTAFVIGAGGVAVDGVAGTPGGSTTFFSLIAGGGLSPSTPGNGGIAGEGGTATGGFLNIPGEGGIPSASASGMAKGGGKSLAPRFSNTHTPPVGGPGSGGSASANGSGSQVGGDGADGILELYEWEV